VANAYQNGRQKREGRKRGRDGNGDANGSASDFPKQLVAPRFHSPNLDTAKPECRPIRSTRCRLRPFLRQRIASPLAKEPR
jgi:hypothetical protein